MRLPETLKPWRAWLDWFDPELAGAIGELLLRLHPMLGAFRVRAQSGQAEPEGVDDLRRRGNYDRLLLSEWALADAAPEEFDRRAAGGEHLFLNPKLVAREVDALTVAVFDSGPSQLGAPRLVHVAMWILLAQRAQAAKARFAWGVLGRPGELHDADSPTMLKRLLSARTYTPGGLETARAVPEDAPPPRERFERDWASYLDGVEPVCNERWSIGAPGAGHALGHRVAVRRSDADEVSVAIAARNARREAVLRLPDPRPAARVLRGEFKNAPIMRAHRDDGRLSLKQPPIISVGGRHVAAIVMGENTVQIYTLPARTGAPQRKPIKSRWGRGKTLLAATLDKLQVGGIVVNGEQLEFWLLNSPSPTPRPPMQDLNAAPGQGRLLPCVRLHLRQQDARVMVLAGDKLLAWALSARRPNRVSSDDLASNAPEYKVIADNVLAILQDGRSRLSYLSRRKGHLVLASVGVGQDRVLETVGLEGEVKSGFLAGSPGPGNSWSGACAVELRVSGHGGERSGLWRIYSWNNQGRRVGDHEVILPADWKVIGLEQGGGGANLLALRPDRCAIVSIGAKERITVYESATRISQVSMLSANGVVTGSSVIALIDMQSRLIVLRDNGKDVLIYGGEHD